MKIMSQTKARKDFFQLAKEVNETSTPIIATNKDNDANVVIMSKADYDSLKETLYILSSPGMAEKLMRGLNENGEYLQGGLDDIV